LSSDPLWYKDAVIYELHVRAFYDSDGDGIGDFRGLTKKLDYLQDLGVTALWLLPFYPSPLRDDGYDIADYRRINPMYGSLADFRLFLREAHRRGLRVITELVINHTSDQHPWFQRSRRSPPGSAARDFYVWSDAPDRYRGTRVIFQDFEPSNWTFDPVAKAYFWHRFYHHQPDLNFDNPEVHKAVLEVLDFWLEMGVDGLRLDAVPYLYEREGTSCENLPETHDYLRKLRRHIHEKYEARMLLAEANQWPEDAAAYFGKGDECHMNFHFPVMPRLFMAIRMEDRFPILDILRQTPQIPESCQWALFLRNHDELTLEMVTDEDRDYMYRAYAHDRRARINLGIRRRLAPLLGNHRRRIELMNGLLLSLPGTPVLYYADEIGMGDNIYLGDRNGVRTPMQWSSDKNAGFSRANPQRLYLPIIIDPEYHYEAVNVEAQQNNPSSLLWWMKRLIGLRKRHRAFGRGSIEFLVPRNHRVLAFFRRTEQETILVVANLSRYVQYAELDLTAHLGAVPVEMFGQTRFPPIGQQPYMLALGPHAFYWFLLETASRPAEPERVEAQEPVPELAVEGSWERLLRPALRPRLEGLLPAYLGKCRWFGGKARRLNSVRLVEAIRIPTAAGTAFLSFLQVSYMHAEEETYLLPLAYAAGEPAERVQKRSPAAVVAGLRVKRKQADKSGEEAGLLYDALADPAFAEALLRAVAQRRRFKGRGGKLLALPARTREPLDLSEPLPEASVLQGEQSNTSVLFGSRWIFKLFRRVEAGINPDLEISRFLTERASFAHVPAVAGALEYHSAQQEPLSVGLFQSFVPNEGDAWRFTLDCLSRYFERILARRQDLGEPRLPRETPVKLAESQVPALVLELLGSYAEPARLLGERTAGLHLALASDPETPDFAPEPVPPQYQRSLYQAVRSLGAKAFQTLRQQLGELPEEVRAEAERALALEERLGVRLHSFLERKMQFQRIRCHGDYHLGQLLYTGRDFVILDFEGEPTRSLSERRLKRSALRDVAGMLRSFHYAVAHALRQATVRPQDVPALEGWGRFWELWVSVVFLKAYLESAGSAAFLPRSAAELEMLLDVLVLEKALYELQYELNNRPDWVPLPLKGIGRLLEGGEAF
jgi:maltose alpha-D-glucosyltransferase/alpha-amylase